MRVHVASVSGCQSFVGSSPTPSANIPNQIAKVRFIMDEQTGVGNGCVPPFESYLKISRLNRDCIITEKIDGTNAQILIEDDGVTMHVGSRTRWLEQGKDNHGFYAWCMKNRDTLLKLGPGRHYGEWWGSGIQRGYELLNGDKRFSLFNPSRWKDGSDGSERNLPDCVGVVPRLYFGPFDTNVIKSVLEQLREHGSYAAPGFENPEGIVIYHLQSHALFKVTLEDDELPKSLVKKDAA